MFTQNTQSFGVSSTAFGRFSGNIIRRFAFLLLPSLFFVSSIGFGQTVFTFPEIVGSGCNPNYNVTPKATITGVQILSSGGSSFNFRLIFSYENTFTGSNPPPETHFWDYYFMFYSTNTNLSSTTADGHIQWPNTLPPLTNSSASGLVTPTNTYNGSTAGGMGLTVGNTYTDNATLALFGFNAATVTVNYRCRNTTTNGVLPVTLSSFTLNSSDNKAVELNWTTADETDNSGFDVEHSLDAKSWSKLGFVQTKAAEGNSTTDIQYSFLHSSPHLGQNYYRLIQNDFDGKSTPSVIRSINVFSAESVVIYPNPVVDIVRISVKDEIGKVSEMGLTDASGKDIKKLSAQTTEVNLSGLSSGVYYLYLLTEKGTVYKKLFKN
jgi:hypothetical protein